MCVCVYLFFWVLSLYRFVVQLCLTLCDPMDCSTLGSPVYLLELAQTHVHQVGDYHWTMSSSVTLFACFQSFPASGSFRMNQLFASGGQSIGASASASVLAKSTQGWFPLRLTVLISLLPKGLSRVFSSTAVWMHQFLSVLPSLLSSSHVCTWPLQRP